MKYVILTFVLATRKKMTIKGVSNFFQLYNFFIALHFIYYSCLALYLAEFNQSGNGGDVTVR
jgi:hypothetical protein